jgi:tRNA U34 5-methylaminomethyl-2-thiouridine-forming methyltransferase MnmC
MSMEIINTADGSHTIFLPGMNEQYHSVNGAITESDYVYVDKGYRFCDTPEPVVFEVGFGTGLNCLLTALESEKMQRKTKYISIEKFPLNTEIISQLNYGKMISAHAERIFNKIHAASWNSVITISPLFSILKIEADLLRFEPPFAEECDVIYFDAFGPDKQPEMWTPAILNKISGLISYGGVFVTYSAKGEVRRNLAACGLVMQRLPGPPGKFQMLRGIKQKANI